MDSTPSLPPVYVLGGPRYAGGVALHLWHTLRLWRRHGLRINLVPTWWIPNAWRRKCRSIGCTIHDCPNAEKLLTVPGLAGATVVAFCNRVFLGSADKLRKVGCRVIWVNCMNWMFAEERDHYRDYGTFDRYVFQSRFQRTTLEAELEPYGYRPRQGHLIRGAFAPDEFPFRFLPHEAGTPFVVGRISRADPDKFSTNTWAIYQRIDPAVRARVLGWSPTVEEKLGAPPSWAECLPVHRETSQIFFSTLHCMLQANGGAWENWPRSGLEAMASGVPVVAPNAWGWREMIRHGQTGFLAENDEELSSHAARLAGDDTLRPERLPLPLGSRSRI